ncbi:MAG: hypothetical protein J0I29_13060 [Rhizobiales bacterium]|nr:hypothetical protein [Hyphomicrobiales bacterium]
MTKLSVAIGAWAVLLFACTGASAAGFNHAIASQNYSPVVKEAACRGFGPHCPPGFTWTCTRYRGCFCRPCY